MKKKIKVLREKNRLSQQELAEQVGVSRSAIFQWERGGYIPNGENLKKLASVLDVSIDYLISEKDVSSAEPDAKSNASAIDKAMMVPVVAKEVSACCGKGDIYSDDVKWEIIGCYPMDPNVLAGYAWQAKDFCIIRAEGDSMEPHISDGDRVLFAKSPDAEVQSGDFAVLIWDGRLLIRGIIFPNEQEVILRPANDVYKDIETKRGDKRLCVLGKVLGITPAFKKTLGLW